MSFLNEAALFFFSTFKTSFSNFYPNYVKHLRKLKQINLPILPFLSRISTNQFNYPRNNRGIRKTQFPIEKLHNSGFLFDADASEQHVYRPAEETGFRIRRGLALDLRCNALERDCIGGRRGEGNSRGSVSWRPFRHVTGRKERYLAIRQYGRPKWTRFTVGIGIQKLVLRSRNGIVTAETAARPPTSPAMVWFVATRQTPCIMKWRRYQGDWMDFHRSIDFLRAGDVRRFARFMFLHYA